MICPDCGELLNYVDDDDISCECGWHGNITKWERDIEDSGR